MQPRLTFSELFLTPTGRLERRGFAAPALLLFVAGLLVTFAQPFWIVGTAALCGYPSYCLYAKRLRDIGGPAWVTLAAMAVAFVATVPLEIWVFYEMSHANAGDSVVSAGMAGVFFALVVPAPLWLLFTLALMVWPGRR